MADITFTVVVGTKAGMLDLAGNVNTELGNAPGADEFLLPNDGKTVVLIHAVTGDTWTVVPVLDKFGRTETLTPTIAAGDIGVIGPFLPELFNDSDGNVHIDPTVGNVADLLLAMSFGNPT